MNRQDAASIQLVLISHTNAGKTTLARTLVGMDIGEVRDAPHVTTVSESHPLLASAAGDALLLWDTPGFGDSVRLARRLAHADNPIGWLLREVVDRYRDRPFWLSQQALRTAREAADVVLYLVNSSEDPQDAGYLDAEMKVLDWLGKPVMVLLNQMGPPRPAAEEQAEQERWRTGLAAYAAVRKVIPLDAFARCWVHERVFYDAIGALVPEEKRAAHVRLMAQWEQHNRLRFESAMALVAQQISAAAHDSEPVSAASRPMLETMAKAVGFGERAGARREDQAMTALTARLEQSIASSTAGLLTLHKLDAGAARTVNERVRKAYVVRTPVDARQAGLLGAVVSGAASGLSADLLSGGLSFGAGALLGGIVGALTFAGAAWTFNTSTGRNASTVQFSDEFLRSLVVAGLLRYLAVAHFGRGRGGFIESEAPDFWQAEVERQIAAREAALLPAIHAEPAALAELLQQIMAQVLDRLYPLPSKNL
jgi:predicted GTPase